uniref:C-type lectin domain-containing protein n=1 Tax=Macrostomum lignano TaxID=282301 RepID=A0A1I8HCD6_9PLAT
TCHENGQEMISKSVHDAMAATSFSGDRWWVGLIDALNERGTQKDGWVWIKDGQVTDDCVTVRKNSYKKLRDETCNDLNNVFCYEDAAVANRTATKATTGKFVRTEIVAYDQPSPGCWIKEPRAKTHLHCSQACLVFEFEDCIGYYWHPVRRQCVLLPYFDASLPLSGSDFSANNQEKLQWMKYKRIHMLGKAERNYSTTDRELLTIVWSLKKFRMYLSSCCNPGAHRPQAPITRLLNAKEPTGRLAHWLQLIQEFPLEILYRPGKENIVPDTLSRAAAVQFQIANLPDEQDQDQVLHAVRHAMLQPDFQVPAAHMRAELLQQAHDQPSAGHLGQRRVLRALRERSWWPDMREDVRDWVRSCLVCQRRKGAPKQGRFPEIADFKTGDRVMLTHQTMKHGQCKSLSNRWSGPFIILKKIGPVNYRLQAVNGRRRLLVHHDPLKRFVDPPNLSDKPPAKPATKDDCRSAEDSGGQPVGPDSRLNPATRFWFYTINRKLIHSVMALLLFPMVAALLLMPASVAATCPGGLIEVTDSGKSWCVKNYNKHVTFCDAIKTCHENGQEMISKSVHDAIVATSFSGDRWWVGLVDALNERGTQKDGWVWIKDGQVTDGSGSVFLSDEPNNLGNNQDCVTIKSDSIKKLRDTTCNDLNNVFCYEDAAVANRIATKATTGKFVRTEIVAYDQPSPGCWIKEPRAKTHLHCSQACLVFEFEDCIGYYWHPVRRQCVLLPYFDASLPLSGSDFSANNQEKLQWMKYKRIHAYNKSAQPISLEVFHFNKLRSSWRLFKPVFLARSDSTCGLLVTGSYLGTTDTRPSSLDSRTLTTPLIIKDVSPDHHLLAICEDCDISIIPGLQLRSTKPIRSLWITWSPAVEFLIVAWTDQAGAAIQIRVGHSLVADLERGTQQASVRRVNLLLERLRQRPGLGVVQKDGLDHRLEQRRPLAVRTKGSPGKPAATPQILADAGNQTAEVDKLLTTRKLCRLSISASAQNCSLDVVRPDNALGSVAAWHVQRCRIVEIEAKRAGAVAAFMPVRHVTDGAINMAVTSTLSAISSYKLYIQAFEQQYERTSKFTSKIIAVIIAEAGLVLGPQPVKAQRVRHSKIDSFEALLSPNSWLLKPAAQRVVGEQRTVARVEHNPATGRHYAALGNTANERCVTRLVLQPGGEDLHRVVRNMDPLFSSRSVDTRAERTPVQDAFQPSSAVSAVNSRQTPSVSKLIAAHQDLLAQSRAHCSPLFSCRDSCVEFESIGQPDMLAKNRVTGQFAALKCVKIDPKDDLKSILTELHVLRDCRHANIVEFFGAYLTENRMLNNLNLWLAMEYCGGKSLQDIYTTTRRPLDEASIAFISREVVRGLMHMHSKHQIHRDVKGANILLTTEGRVKLADFGISAQITETLGKRMSFIGTPYWMAPEIADVKRKGGYDERCDIWSVGITAIELAELEPPLFNMQPLKALQYMTTSRFKPAKLRDKAAWSGAFHDFLKATLRMNPRNRPAASELLSHQFLVSPALGEHLTVALLRLFQEACRRQHSSFEQLLKASRAGGVLPESQQQQQQGRGRLSPLFSASTSSVSSGDAAVDDVDNNDDNDKEADVELTAELLEGDDEAVAAEDAAASAAAAAAAAKAGGRRRGSASVGGAAAAAVSSSRLISQHLLRGPNQQQQRRRVFGSQESLLDNAGAFVKVPGGLQLLFESCPLKINDTAKWTTAGGDPLLLLGANEGLYCLGLGQLQEAGAMVQLVPMRCLWLFVHRGVLTALCGKHPQLYRFDLGPLLQERQALSSRLLPGNRNRGGTKVPGTKGCIRVAVKRHPGTGERWLACALPDSVLLLRWDQGRRAFLACRLTRAHRLPQPLLTFELLIRPGRALPVACLGAVKTTSTTGAGANSWAGSVRYRLLDLSRTETQVFLWPTVEDELQQLQQIEEVGVVSLAQLDMSAVLLCHRGLATVHDLDTGRLKAPTPDGHLSKLSFDFTLERAQVLDEIVLAFYKHGYQARAFLGGRVLQEVSDRNRVYRFLGYADRNAVLERRPVSDPMANCDLVMVVGDLIDADVPA